MNEEGEIVTDYTMAFDLSIVSVMHSSRRD